MLKICLFVSAIAVVFGKHITPCAQVDQFNDYSIVFFQKLIKVTGENLALSAYATGKLLSLIMLGARGETARQIKDALNLVGSDRDIKNWFRGLTLELNAAKNLTIDTAIKAYLAECVDLNADFENLATNYFDAGVENINFYDPEQTALKINNWVQNKTDNEINKIIDENNINALTRLIFINTLYFSGEFKYPFSISATEKADFFISKTESVKVDMMTISGYYLMSRHPDLGVSMIYIPFKNQRAKFLLIVPDAVEKAEYVQNNILTIWHNRNFTKRYVQVFLPRFKLASALLMKPILEKLGITRLFSKPDLNGISRDDIALSEVFQSAFIDVNEIGANAGPADTVPVEDVALTLPGPKIKPYVLKVNLPYLCSVLYDGLGASMIYIPYKNQRAKLFILIPDVIEKAEYVQNNIRTIWRNRNVTQKYVQVFLPRFRIVSDHSLKPLLETLGITRLFSQPDLSGISTDDIVASEVFQRAVIDVNELGTNAGAADAG
ncbi:hypothetical protein WA026_005623 [Henosepilachna vigintioctopunctata]|uniref:Serpin domain-containing protein n=1 Tax=Henosepilachna vigintioctopunctata TaxID=420089 RepID=A0AAW1U1P6_9CUCU